MDNRVFVDHLRVHVGKDVPTRRAGAKFGHRWCHLWSENREALHAIAEQIGMRREWFQDRPGFPHYDLRPDRRARAIALGAIERSLKDYLRSRDTTAEAHCHV